MRRRCHGWRCVQVQESCAGRPRPSGPGESPRGPSRWPPRPAGTHREQEPSMGWGPRRRVSLFSCREPTNSGLRLATFKTKRPSWGRRPRQALFPEEGERIAGPLHPEPGAVWAFAPSAERPPLPALLRCPRCPRRLHAGPPGSGSGGLPANPGKDVFSSSGGEQRGEKLLSPFCALLHLCCSCSLCFQPHLCSQGIFPFYREETVAEFLNSLGGDGQAAPEFCTAATYIESAVPSLERFSGSDILMTPPPAASP